MDGNSSLKSSVLSPVSRRIFDQFHALKQIQSHHTRIGGSKAVVDTSPPKSLKKSIVRKDQQQRSAQHSSKSSSRTNSCLSSASGSKSVETIHNSQSISNEARVPTHHTNNSRSSSVADKISWYLEAIQNSSVPVLPWNKQQEMPLLYNSPYAGTISKGKTKNENLTRHAGCFALPGLIMYPRSHNRTESKVKKMEHCYNPPPMIKKTPKTSARQETQDLERLLQQRLRQLEHQETCYEKWLEDQAQRAEARKEVLLSSRVGTSNSFSSRLRQPSSLHTTHLQMRSSDSGRETDKSSQHSHRANEEKQLEFVASITEEILRSGLFSDSAIKQTVRFHLEEKSWDLEDDKIQLLVDKLLSDLCISDNQKNNIKSSITR